MLVGIAPLKSGVLFPHFFFQLGTLATHRVAAAPLSVAQLVALLDLDSNQSTCKRGQMAALNGNKNDELVDACLNSLRRLG